MIGKAAILERAREWQLTPDVVEEVTSLSGIQFPSAEIRVNPRRNQAGEATFEGVVGYVGPLAAPGPPKIRFDLTNHEPVLRLTERRTVFHPYPDELPHGVEVCTYSVGELVAEKTRALFERTRPHDLYARASVAIDPSARRLPAPAARGGSLAR